MAAIADAGNTLFDIFSDPCGFNTRDPRSVSDLAAIFGLEAQNVRQLLSRCSFVD